MSRHCVLNVFSSPLQPSCLAIACLAEAMEQEPEEAAEAMEQEPEEQPALDRLWEAAAREHRARMVLQEAMRQYEEMTMAVPLIVTTTVESMDCELIAQCRRVLDLTLEYYNTLLCLIRAHHDLPREPPPPPRPVPTPPPPPPRPSSIYD